MFNKLDIEKFKLVLNEVLKQVTEGKGNQRHGNNIPFESQPWKYITDNVGKGFVLGQALKKILELRTHEQNIILNSENPDTLANESYNKWRSDALGSIVYMTMAIMYMDYEQSKK